MTNKIIIIIEIRGFAQFPWRDFQTERKNITFKTLKISKFQKTLEKSQKIPRNFHCVEFVKFNAMEIAWIFSGFS